MEIGSRGVYQLKQLGIAEISVCEDGIDLATKERALGMLSNHLDWLLTPPDLDGHAKINSFFSYAHGQGPNYTEISSQFFSSRLDGESVMLIKGGNGHTLEIGTLPAKRLFFEMGLQPAFSALADKPVVLFDLLTVWGNGARFEGVVRMPLELVNADLLSS